MKNLKYDRKVIKDLYNLRFNKNLSVREVRFIVKQKYNIEITPEYISNVLRINKSKAKTKYSESDKRRILYFYKNCYNLNLAIDYLNNKYNYKINKHYVYKLASDNNVTKNIQDGTSRKILTRKEEKRICDRYVNGESAFKIIKDYEFKTVKSIYDILDRSNIKRKNGYDHMVDNKSYNNFKFDVLDDDIKAYFLGLIITDGYIYSNENVSKNYIELSLIDEDCISFLANYINCNYRKLNTESKSRKSMFRLEIHGKQYIDNIFRFGLHQNKTYNIGNIHLYDNEKKFIPSIIRGIIDGDGWIRKDGKEFYILSASKEFLVWVKNELEDLGFINLNIKTLKKENHISSFNSNVDLFIIRTSVKHNINLLKTIIYPYEMGMSRKYNRVHQIN